MCKIENAKHGLRSINTVPIALLEGNLYPGSRRCYSPQYYFTSKDSVEVGEPVNFGIAFKNISNVDFDSVMVKFLLQIKNNQVDNYRLSRTKKALVPEDTITLNVPINTTIIARS